MHYVSLIIEFLRGRPAVVFWTVALTQAVLWTVMPALFYSAPPGEVPLLLAIGHEFVLGSYLGPPLAFWLGETAFRLAGAFGLYALAQACIVVTYWAVFTLGRRIVGTRHAVLAVLLMVGIAAFTVPSPDFGPAVLAAPLWSLALLHYWRAVGEGERGSWFLLALDLGLLLLASYVGLILIALMARLHAGDGARARRVASIRSRGSRCCRSSSSCSRISRGCRARAISSSPASTTGRGRRHAVARPLALHRAGVHPSRPRPAGRARQRLAAPAARTRAGDRPQSGRAVGAAVRLCLRADAGGDRRSLSSSPAAAWDRSTASRRWWCSPASPSWSPPATRCCSIASGWCRRPGSACWSRRRSIVVLGLVLMPWTFAVDLKIAQPANAEGRFFADNFQRRTGKPLNYVTGDAASRRWSRSAPSRPHVYFDWAPQRSPWASPADARSRAASWSGRPATIPARRRRR